MVNMAHCEGNIAGNTEKEEAVDNDLRTMHIKQAIQQFVQVLLEKKKKYKLLCPRGTQTCALAVANIKVNGNTARR